MTALIDARVCIVTEYPKLAPIEDANAAPVLIVETSSAALIVVLGNSSTVTSPDVALMSTELMFSTWSVGIASSSAACTIATSMPKAL